MGNDIVEVNTNKPERKKYVLKKRESLKSDYKVNYESDLNPAQLDAVISKQGPILVIAGAGSGKTKTLHFPPSNEGRRDTAQRLQIPAFALRTSL